VGTADASVKPVEPNYSIDVIRFVAITFVIVLHCTAFPYEFLNPTVSSMDILNWFTSDFYAAVGLIGVPLFIMLTGALLLNPNREDEPLKVFYKKRLDRIALPFIFWTVVYFAWSFTVLGKPLTLFNIGQGLVSGSYFHLWYLYLLMGLYAVTPVLRVLIKHLDRKLFTYLIVLWFLGTVTTPFIHTFTDFRYQPFTWVFFDGVGYFLLGTYLLYSNIKRRRAALIFTLGILGTVIGEWLLTAGMGKTFTGYFHNYMNPTIIIASVALFTLLISMDFNAIGKHAKTSRVIHWVSQNSLPLYLIHMIVLVTLSVNVFGVWLNSATYIPLLDVPIFAVIVFAVSAALVYVFKKVPVLKRLIG
jgi:surface polysaccharide O-acyltransferase-like enzyme